MWQFDPLTRTVQLTGMEDTVVTAPINNEGMCCVANEYTACFADRSLLTHPAALMKSVTKYVTFFKTAPLQLETSVLSTSVVNSSEGVTQVRGLMSVK